MYRVALDLLKSKSPLRTESDGGPLKSRVLARVVARELTPEELDMVGGAGDFSCGTKGSGDVSVEFN